MKREPHTDVPAVPDSPAKLDGARNDDREALVFLLGTLASGIRRSISIDSQWAPVLDVEDVIQVTFMEAFLRLGQFVSDHHLPEQFRYLRTKAAPGGGFLIAPSRFRRRPLLAALHVVRRGRARGGR